MLNVFVSSPDLFSMCVHNPSSLPAFIPLLILSSEDQDVGTKEIGRGGRTGTGKEEEPSLSLHVLWLPYGLSSTKRVHGQGLTLKLSFTNYRVDVTQDNPTQPSLRQSLLSLCHAKQFERAWDS